MNIPQLSQFEQHKNDEFTIRFNPELASQCRVKEITISNAPTNQQGEKQFSVVFVKPDSVVFEQGVYPVSHHDLGDFELFLVPIFGDTNEVHYEAVFS